MCCAFSGVGNPPGARLRLGGSPSCVFQTRLSVAPAASVFSLCCQQLKYRDCGFPSSEAPAPSAGPSREWFHTMSIFSSIISLQLQLLYTPGIADAVSLYHVDNLRNQRFFKWLACDHTAHNWLADILNFFSWDPDRCLHALPPWWSCVCVPAMWCIYFTTWDGTQ